jgi:Tfp pilus assembly protein PilZ
MQAKRESRKSGRFSHECIVKFGDGQALSAYYAVSCNLSETGMYFKSLFELHPGAHIFVRIDDYELSRNQVQAKVVWCKEIETTSTLKYGVGAEFLQSKRHVGLKASTRLPHSADAREEEVV